MGDVRRKVLAGTLAAFLSGIACSAVPAYSIAATQALDAAIPSDASTADDVVTSPEAGGRFRVFVTYEKAVGSSLGGIAGADTFCQRRGARFNPAGTFLAYLWQSATDSPDKRIPKGRAYYRVGSEEKVFDSIDQGPIIPILHSERGEPVEDFETWVGNSEPSATGRCGNWTGAVSVDGGVVSSAGGLANDTLGWRSVVTMSCDAWAHLYCFQVDP